MPEMTPRPSPTADAASGTPEPAMRAAAFFDLDRTLIRGSANFPFAIEAFKNGMVTKRELWGDFRNAVAFVRHGASDERSEALRERILRAVKGYPKTQVIGMAELVVPRLVAMVLPEANELLIEHKDRGEDRVVVSASPQEIVELLSKALGLEGAVGTRAAVDLKGIYTGGLAGAFCYGPGKVVEVQRLADERGYDLARCTAYSDSISDLAFLECVGTPVAVNPDKELRELATERGWRIVEVQQGNHWWSRLLHT